MFRLKLSSAGAKKVPRMLLYLPIVDCLGLRQERHIAVNCFAKALELQPRSGEYRASLQRARGA